MKPFDFLNIFFEKKKIPTEEEINKDCNQYILNMTLSCDKQFTEIAHEMSKLKISNKMYFDCLYHGIPQGKRFIKYNAQRAAKDKKIQYLMKYFKCSQETAKQYVNIISDDEMKHITDYFVKRGLK